MLVLSRKIGEKIHIGNNITVTVVEVSGNRVKLGLEAPDSVRILRSELGNPQQWEAPAAGAERPVLTACR